MQTAFESFKIFRADMKAQLGDKAIKALHQQKPWIDWSVFILITVLLFSLMYVLYALPFGVLWVICLIAQGFVMQSFGLFAHDAFTHRRVGGKKLSYLCDLFSTIPYFRLPTQYYDLHLRHHQYLNTQEDPEVQILNSLGKQTRLKKMALFSIIGAFLAELKGVNNVKNTARFSEKVKIEKKIRIGFVIFIFSVTIFFPAFFIYGYWLPMLIVLPPITAFRILLEHGEINPNNSIQAATNYRSGKIFQVLHLFDSGDCHLIHHIYPNIPFYQMSKAVSLLMPYLIENQRVYEHRSLVALVYGVFIKNHNFREHWSSSAQAVI